jgi:hypothetical protein
MDRHAPAFDPAAAADVCAAVRRGIGLDRLDDTPGLPGWDVVSAWLAAEPGFLAEIDRARDIHCRFMEDEILSLADSLDRDSTLADRSRVRQAIAYRKWLMCVRNPSRYGRVAAARFASPGAPVQANPTPPEVRAPGLSPRDEAIASRRWLIAVRNPAEYGSSARRPSGGQVQAGAVAAETPGQGPAAMQQPTRAWACGSPSVDMATADATAVAGPALPDPRPELAPRLSRRDRRAMAARARKAPSARATSPPG